ncbi:phenol hydroxylase, carboxy-terminal dimerization domain protein, partial [Rhizoctonia solani AG-3 Rhs1AP]
MPSTTSSTMLVFWLALLSILPTALSAPVTGSTKGVGKCTNPAIRREWRTLSQDQRDSFHSAVKCLQTKPSALNVPESQTLYDDFSYVHYTINVTIHHVSSFFPWHRYFLVLHEAAMAECGYSDPIPYWDWTRDSTVETFKSSEMFDTKKGFGGDDSKTTGPTVCVETTYAGSSFPHQVILRAADSALLTLHLFKSDNMYKIVIYRRCQRHDTKTKLEELGESLNRWILRRPNMFQVYTIMLAEKEDANYTGVPKSLRPYWDTVFIDDVAFSEKDGGGRAYQSFGVGPEGCLALVRPDGHVAALGSLEPVEALQALSCVKVPLAN